MSDEVRNFRVIKIDSDLFTVDDGARICCVRARKTLRRNDIRVGDFVRIAGEPPVIEEVLPRKNALIRPAVANVDTILIVLAPEPVPDYLTADKLVVNCLAAGIRPAVCFNKNDLPFDSASAIAQYAGFADDVVSVSAVNGDTAALRPVLSGRLTALAGQSAVGKSSLVNALTGLNRATGGLSERVMRGRNTTTRAEIVPLGGGAYIVDTPGFSMLDLFDVRAEELSDYYGYTAFAGGCRFGGRCTHTSEPDCAVRHAAETGETNRARYERYVKLYAALRSARKYG